jgi:hypothetical protein
VCVAVSVRALSLSIYGNQAKSNPSDSRFLFLLQPTLCKSPQGFSAATSLPPAELGTYEMFTFEQTRSARGLWNCSSQHESMHQWAAELFGSFTFFYLQVEDHPRMFISKLMLFSGCVDSRKRRKKFPHCLRKMFSREIVFVLHGKSHRARFFLSSCELRRDVEKQTQHSSSSSLAFFSALVLCLVPILNYMIL